MQPRARLWLRARLCSINSAIITKRSIMSAPRSNRERGRSVDNTARRTPPPGGSAGMPPGRPAPYQATIDAQAAQLLAELARRIASSLELRQTLQFVVQAVVNQLGFGCALVNLVRPGDMCEVVAIAGPEEATRALLGTRASVESWHRLLASCESWGELRFLDPRSDQGQAKPTPGWVPPIEPSDIPDAWHPDDILLAPLHAPGAALIGVLSIDMPVDGRLLGLDHGVAH